MGGDARKAPLRLVRLEPDRAEIVRRNIAVALEGVPPELAAEFLALVDRRTASKAGWGFVMVNPEKDLEVSLWISKHASRKTLTAALWAVCKSRIDPDTGEVLSSRARMIELTGAHSSHISAALSELVNIKALERRKEGREVRWFLNARVATHQTGAARDAAQRDAPELVTLTQFTVLRGNNPSP